MHARLNPACGWRWQAEDGTYGFFTLSDVCKYAGMLSGRTPAGRITTRPQIDFDALSHDGIEWHPYNELKALIPWEDGVRVQYQDVPLPE